MEKEEVLSLSPMQLDALREIGNIGAGNAATALSQIINRKIDMSVPRLNILPLSEVPDVVGGADTMVAGVYLRVFGPAPSSILFLLPRDSAFSLVDMAMGRERGTTDILNAMDESALMEIGNILAGSFLNALSYFTKMTLLPSLPALAILYWPSAMDSDFRMICKARCESVASIIVSSGAVGFLRTFTNSAVLFAVFTIISSI